MSYYSMIVASIENDTSLSKLEKLRRLEDIASQAGDLRRASASPEDTDDTKDDLAAVRQAITKLANEESWCAVAWGPSSPVGISYCTRNAFASRPSNLFAREMSPAARRRVFARSAPVIIWTASDVEVAPVPA
jgi:hypothetical protein